MATVTSLTADRMLAIEAASVVDGDIVGNDLILTKHDGSQINAGNVRGPTGATGPVGQDLVVAQAAPVLDVGLANQIRAGRQLTVADFTNMGLSVPIGLWNLSDLTDASGNGRALSNKGAVTFASGINGGANSAAKFIGSSAQTLYISDTGVNDPFRIKSGSVGCWFKTAKGATNQQLLSKRSGSAPSAYYLQVNNAVNFTVNINTGDFSAGNYAAAASVTNVVDDRWHFVVGTYDGTIIRLYLDGVLEGVALLNGFMFPASAPFNIGAFQGDGATLAGECHFGRIDEGFITNEVMTDDQVRNLYCAKLPHTLAAVPTRLSLNVRRFRRDPLLVVGDFTTQPLVMYNFSGGSLGNEGSLGAANVLANPNATAPVVGVDGKANNAFNFGPSKGLNSTDAGLPNLLTPRSYGCWFKTTMTTPGVILTWGVTGTNDARLQVGYPTAGCISSLSAADQVNGPFVADGQWHHLVITEFNAVGAPTDDGIKRKMFLDGRLVAFSTVLTSLTLAGASKFIIGSDVTGAGGNPFTGQIDSMFVTNYILTSEDVFKLYAKGTQALTPSPKNVGDHVEAMDAANILATFDTLESQHQIDLRVAP